MKNQAHNMWTTTTGDSNLLTRFIMCLMLLTGAAGCGASETTNTGSSSDTSELIDGSDTVATCAPVCLDNGCGDDGCGGSCGTCAESESCFQGQCVVPSCIADCTGKECGGDGCGGTCGSCAKGRVCSPSATCRAPTPNCIPTCGDKTCGPDGCGDDCGACGNDSACVESGVCKSQGAPCGTTGSAGFCDGATLIYCAQNELKLTSCTGDTVCEYNSASKWFECAPAPCIPTCPSPPHDGGQDDGCGGMCPAMTPCGEILEGGTCDGSVLRYCRDDALVVVDCEALGLGCTTIEPGWMDCADICTPACDGLPAGAPDSCGGVCVPTSCRNTPSCVGNILHTCADGVLSTLDCAEAGQVCALSEGEAFCAETECTPQCDMTVPGANDGCGAICPGTPGDACFQIPPEGQCIGDTLQLCLNAAVLLVDCTLTNQQCAPTDSGAECLDCTPSCDAKECGDDGCGGSCGVCDALSACVEYSCQPNPCNGVSVQGACDGDTLQICSQNTLEKTDCTQQGKICSLENGTAACIEPPCIPNCDGKLCGPDGCGGSCGECDEGVCAITECVVSGCGPAAEESICVGTQLLTCNDANELSPKDCAEFGLVCGKDPNTELIDCYSVDACAPDCQGKSCGPDGCGGTCGECAAGAECSQGDCKTPCGEIGPLGACEGSTLRLCVSDNLVVLDCADAGLLCTTSSVTGQSSCESPCQPSCLGAECGSDGCGGTCGNCDTDQTCQLGQCIDVSNACGDITSAGACDGDTLKYCQDGVLYSIDCSAFGGSCAESSSGAADCQS